MSLSIQTHYGMKHASVKAENAHWSWRSYLYVFLRYLSCPDYPAVRTMPTLPYRYVHRWRNGGLSRQRAPSWHDFFFFTWPYGQACAVAKKQDPRSTGSDGKITGSRIPRFPWHNLDAISKFQRIPQQNLMRHPRSIGSHYKRSGQDPGSTGFP